MTRSKSVSGDPVLNSRQTRKVFKTHRRVLVVEADKMMRQLLAAILDDNNFEVAMVSADLIALEQLHQPVDFILLSTLQSEADGLTIYSRLRANPTTKDIPIMVLLTSPDKKNIEQVSRLGIQHFLSKPFTEDELLLKILALLLENSRKEP